MQFNCCCLIKTQWHHLPSFYPPSYPSYICNTTCSLLNLLSPLLQSLFHMFQNEHISNTSGVHSGLPACIFLVLRFLNWIFFLNQDPPYWGRQNLIYSAKSSLIVWSSSSWGGALKISSIYSKISISARIILVLFGHPHC